MLIIKKDAEEEIQTDTERETQRERERERGRWSGGMRKARDPPQSCCPADCRGTPSCVKFCTAAGY